jgi:CrcB protein
LSEAIARAVGDRFPYGTLAVNLSGCFIIGLLYGLGETRFALSSQGRLLLMVGFCGAFTTFSSWMLETSVLLDQGHAARAYAYVLGSVLVGFTLFRAGTVLPKTVWAPSVGAESALRVAPDQP